MSKQMPLLSLAACLAMVIVLASGCAPKKEPAKPAEAAAPAPQPVTLGQMKSELLESKAQVQTTSDSLVKLQKSSTADAQGNYNAFTEQYLKLQAKADSVKTRADDLKAKSAAYHEMWNKQLEVQNPELRRQVVQQKANAEQVYNTISSEMELLRMTFSSYMANLKDVGNYLRGNLSPASLQASSDLVAKADSQGKQVNAHLDAIIGAIDKISAATGESVATQPAAPAGAPK